LNFFLSFRSERFESAACCLLVLAADAGAVFVHDLVEGDFERVVVVKEKNPKPSRHCHCLCGSSLSCVAGLWYDGDAGAKCLSLTSNFVRFKKLFHQPEPSFTIR
jgi:hypothetical protein